MGDGMSVARTSAEDVGVACEPPRMRTSTELGKGHSTSDPGSTLWSEDLQPTAEHLGLHAGGSPAEKTRSCRDTVKFFVSVS